jgi:hypothetical protein
MVLLFCYLHVFGTADSYRVEMGIYYNATYVELSCELYFDSNNILKGTNARLR